MSTSNIKLEPILNVEASFVVVLKMDSLQTQQGRLETLDPTNAIFLHLS
jgi:hypothetical protein